MVNRVLAIGDIHGNYQALVQALERAQFDRSTELLIALGDYTDRKPDSALVVQYLIDLPHFVGIRGNHDIWAQQWLETGIAPDGWYVQGGAETIESYRQQGLEKDEKHQVFFATLKDYYVLTILGRQYAFVHGGWTHPAGLGHEDSTIYCWNRSLWKAATSGQVRAKARSLAKKYHKVFIGHTPTHRMFPSLSPPVKALNIINLDQGAGWNGKLTVCDVVTEQCWQSD